MGSTRMMIGAAALGGFLALFAGCGKEETPVATPPAPPAPKAPAVTIALPADLTAMKAEVEKGKAALDGLLASLDATVAAADGDPRPPFAKFQKDLDGLKAQVGTIRSRADAMKAKGKDYFKAWETKLAEIATPEIKKAAEARKDELSKIYDAILADMAKSREGFDKYFAFLTDLSKVMENDLNAQGLKALAPKVTQAKEDGAQVKATVDAVVSEIDKIAAIYSPGK
jgi:hypothetical protein